MFVCLELNVCKKKKKKKSSLGRGAKNPPNKTIQNTSTPKKTKTKQINKAQQQKTPTKPQCGLHRPCHLKYWQHNDWLSFTVQLHEGKIGSCVSVGQVYTIPLNINLCEDTQWEILICCTAVSSQLGEDLCAIITLCFYLAPLVMLLLSAM